MTIHHHSRPAGKAITEGMDDTELMPDEWRNELCDLLVSKGLSYLQARSDADKCTRWFYDDLTPQQAMAE